MENETIVISSMKSATWGGSEELWFKFVLYGVNKKHNFEIVLFDNGGTNEKIKKLESLNEVNVTKLQDPECERPFLLKRILLRVLKREVPHVYKNRYEFLNSCSAGNVVISLGDFFDLLYYPDLADFCLNTNKKVTLIIQHFYEFGYVNLVDRERLVKILSSIYRCCFVSIRNRETIERMLLFKIENAVIIKNPVNLDNCDYVNFPLDNGVLKMASVARLSVIAKGQDILLSVLSSNVWRDRDFMLEMYGSGPDFTYIKNLIRFYDLEKKVIIKGHATNIREVWQNNEILILSSRSEGTPLSLLEAMICGRSAIVTDVGDCARIVEDGNSGFVSVACTEKALAESLERVWENKNELVVMGENARKKVKKYYEILPEKELFNLVCSR